MRRLGTLLFLLSGIALAAWLSGCGPCRKPVPPPPDLPDPDEAAVRPAERVEIPDDPDEDQPGDIDEYSEAAMMAKYFDHPPGVETNLVDIPGWIGTMPWGSKFGGRFGERVYRQDKKAVLVRLGRVETETARMTPQFEIGYKYETRVQQVEMLEIDGYPVMINHHPHSKLGSVEIILMDGYGKIDFNYRNMDIDEAMAFTRNFIMEDLEKNLAAHAAAAQ